MTPPQSRSALLAGFSLCFCLYFTLFSTTFASPTLHHKVSSRQADVVIDKRFTPSPFPTQIPTTPTPPPASPQPQPVQPQQSPPTSQGQASVTPIPPSPTPPVSEEGTAAPQTTPEPNAVRRGLTTGGIVAIVLGALALLAFLILLLLFVFRRSNTIRENPDTELGPGAAARGLGGASGTSGAGGGYPTPETSTVPPVPPASSDLPPQEVELAEAEAETGYVVSDTARHHSGVPPAAVEATAAGAGAAGIVVAAPPEEPERSPSPAPHDYVVGVGQVKDKEQFEEIQTQFANNEIKDNTAVLGAPPAIEAPLDAPNPDVPSAVAEADLGATERAVDIVTPPASVPTPEVGDTKAGITETDAPLETPSEVVENVGKADEIATSNVDAPTFDTSGDVSEAARGLGVTEIIAEEAAVTPALEKDSLPLRQIDTPVVTDGPPDVPNVPDAPHQPSDTAGDTGGYGGPRNL